MAGRSSIRLGIGVNDKHAIVFLLLFPQPNKGMREIDHSGRFANAAFVVHNRQYDGFFFCLGRKLLYCHMPSVCINLERLHTVGGFSIEDAGTIIELVETVIGIERLGLYL